MCLIALCDTHLATPAFTGQRVPVVHIETNGDTATRTVSWEGSANVTSVVWCFGAPFTTDISLIHCKVNIGLCVTGNRPVFHRFILTVYYWYFIGLYFSDFCLLISVCLPVWWCFWISFLQKKKKKKNTRRKQLYFREEKSLKV